MKRTFSNQHHLKLITVTKVTRLIFIEYDFYHCLELLYYNL